MKATTDAIGEQFDYLNSIAMLLGTIKILADDQSGKEFEVIKELADKAHTSICSLHDSMVSALHK
jgi:hypothetical protein